MFVAKLEIRTQSREKTFKTNKVEIPENLSCRADAAKINESF
jgi:hypothetical protein